MVVLHLRLVVRVVVRRADQGRMNISVISAILRHGYLWRWTSLHQSKYLHWSKTCGCYYLNKEVMVVLHLRLVVRVVVRGADHGRMVITVISAVLRHGYLRRLTTLYQSKYLHWSKSCGCYY